MSCLSFPFDVGEKYLHSNITKKKRFNIFLTYVHQWVSLCINVILLIIILECKYFLIWNIVCMIDEWMLVYQKNCVSKCRIWIDVWTPCFGIDYPKARLFLKFIGCVSFVVICTQYINKVWWMKSTRLKVFISQLNSLSFYFAFSGNSENPIEEFKGSGKLDCF